MMVTPTMRSLVRCGLTLLAALAIALCSSPASLANAAEPAGAQPDVKIIDVSKKDKAKVAEAVAAIQKGTERGPASTDFFIVQLEKKVVVVASPSRIAAAEKLLDSIPDQPVPPTPDDTVVTSFGLGQQDLAKVDLAISLLQKNLRAADKQTGFLLMRFGRKIVVAASRKEYDTILAMLAPIPTLEEIKQTEPALAVDEVNVTGMDPAKVNAILTTLQKSLHPTDSQGFVLTLVGDRVIVRGLPDEIAAVRNVLGRIQPDEASGSKDIDVSDRDPLKVTAALDALRARPKADPNRPSPLFIQTATTVTVWGTTEERETASALLGSLPRLATRHFYLKVSANSPAVQFCLDQENLTAVLRQGQKLVVRGPDTALSRLETKLKSPEFDLAYDGDGGAECKPVTEIVRLHFFRDPMVLMSLMDSVQKACAADVQCKYGASDARNAIVLYGPKGQVDELKRRIALLDVPLPQIKLDLWAIQLSGHNADGVAKKAQEAQERIAIVRRLVSGYLGVIERCSLDVQEAAKQYDSELHAVVHTVLRELKQTQPEASVRLDQLSAEDAERVALNLMASSSLGGYRLSLTQTLALAVMGESSSLKPLPDRLQMSLGAWLLLQALRDPAAVRIGSDELTTQDDPGLVELGQRLRELPEVLRKAKLTYPSGLPTDERKCAELAHQILDSRLDLVPKRLVEMVADAGKMARNPAGEQTPSALLSFLCTRMQLVGAPGSVSPERIAMTTANAQVELQAAEQALNDDISRLFIQPLLCDLRRIAGKASCTGVASVSETSLTVLSGTTASVQGTAVSYFDVTQQPKLDATTLQAAADLNTKLGSVIPLPGASSEDQCVCTVSLATGTDAASWTTALSQTFTPMKAVKAGDGLLLMGTETQVQGALTTLRAAEVLTGEKLTRRAREPQYTPTEVLPGISGTIAPASGLASLLGSVSGIPVDRLLSLALALGSPDRVWSAMTEGASLDFTPAVVPGGGAAGLRIDATVTHDNPGDSGESASRAVAPLSRVARHHINTSVDLNPLDMFVLSSFNLRTTRPRPDFVVPMLGQIPLLGRIFHFTLSPDRVHHESLLLGYTTILPTATDLAELMVVGTQDQAALK